MNKANENIKLVPELRFGEFSGDGNWKITQLGHKTKKVGSGKTPRGGDKNYKVEGRPFVRSQNIGWGVLITNNIVFIDEEVHKTFLGSEIKENDVLLNITGASIGRSAIANSVIAGGNVNQHVCIIRTKEKELNPVFLNQFIISFQCRRQIYSFQAGGNREGLNFGQIRSFDIPLPPSFPEQQKIAATLTSLDHLIAAENEKLEALQAHKNGLLQQLFPEKGEKVPELRFPEFQGGWIDEPLDKVYSFKITNSLSRSKLNYDEGQVKNIHYGDIHTKFSTLFDITKEDVPYINQDVPLDRIDEENYCLEGDIVIADASEDLDDIGKSLEIVNLNNEKLLSGLHTFLARQIEPKLIIGFGGHLFKSKGIRKQIKREAQGAKVLGISKGRISGIKIYYPKEETEQQKIAQTLTSLDDLIAAENEKLEALQAHKKGLLQQLFPNVNTKKS